MGQSPKAEKIMSTLAVFLFVNLYVLFDGVDSSPINTRNCNSDADCIDANSYCYLKTLKCAQCINCTTYNRHFKPNICAREPNQCGGCFDGTIAESHSDGSFSPTCTRQKNQTVVNPVTPYIDPVTPTTEDSSIFSIDLWYIVSIVIIVIVIIAIGCYYIYTRHNQTCCDTCPTSDIFRSYLCSNRSVNNNNNGLPPPYSEKSPSAPPYECGPTQPQLGDPPDERITRVRLPQVDEQSQRATPFSNPTAYIRGGPLESNYNPEHDSEPTEEEEEQENAENEALISSTNITSPDDEETLPSQWTPNPANATSTSPQPTSFANILNNPPVLNITQPETHQNLDICRRTENINMDDDGIDNDNDDDDNHEPHNTGHNNHHRRHHHQHPQSGNAENQNASSFDRGINLNVLIINNSRFTATPQNL